MADWTPPRRTQGYHADEYASIQAELDQDPGYRATFSANPKNRTNRATARQYLEQQRPDIVKRLQAISPDWQVDPAGGLYTTAGFEAKDLWPLLFPVGGAALNAATAPAASGASASAAPSGVIPSSQIPAVAAAAPIIPGAAPVGGLTVYGATGGGAAALSVADQLKKALTSPSGVANLAGLVASLAAGSRSGGGSGEDVMGQSPQLQELMQMGTERVKRTDPLHQAVTQLAMSRLPTNVQR